MLSKNPIDFDEMIDDESMDKEMIRAAIVAKLDAAKLFEQFASCAASPMVRKALSGIAKDERAHIGQFESILLHLGKVEKRKLTSINSKQRIQNELL